MWGRICAGQEQTPYRPSTEAANIFEPSFDAEDDVDQDEEQGALWSLRGGVSGNYHSLMEGRVWAIHLSADYSNWFEGTCFVGFDLSDINQF